MISSYCFFVAWLFFSVTWDCTTITGSSFLCCYVCVIMHACVKASCLCTIYRLSPQVLCVVSNYSERKGKKPIWAFSPSIPLCFAPPATGVSVTVAHHILNFHHRMILELETPQRDYKARLSHHSKKNRFISLKLQIQIWWTLESKVSCWHISHRMNKKERWLGWEQILDLGLGKSFNPRMHAPS